VRCSVHASDLASPISACSELETKLTDPFVFVLANRVDRGGDELSKDLDAAPQRLLADRDQGFPSGFGGAVVSRWICGGSVGFAEVPGMGTVFVGEQGVPGGQLFQDGDAGGRSSTLRRASDASPEVIQVI